MMEIKDRKEKALQELRLLNKSEISDNEFFRVWNKHLYGYINMFRFEDFLQENGIIVKR